MDEFGASELHIGVLSARTIHDLFVIARDPRAAARSQVHRLGLANDNFVSLERKIERECIENFIPWLQGWIDCANNPQTPFRIHWITFAQILTDPVVTARRMSAVLEEKYPAMAAHSDWQSLEEARRHDVTECDQVWRSEVGEYKRQRLWDACTPEIRTLLDLEN